MEELKPLVGLDNYNIFSFLCRVKGLARSVVESSNRMPCVLSTTDLNNPWNVIVGGVTITVETLRTAYKSSLAKCETLMRKMLLGTEGVSMSSIIHPSPDRRVPV